MMIRFAQNSTMQATAFAKARISRHRTMMLTCDRLSAHMQPPQLGPRCSASDSMQVRMAHPVSVVVLRNTWNSTVDVLQPHTSLAPISPIFEPPADKDMKRDKHMTILALKLLRAAIKMEIQLMAYYHGMLSTDRGQ
ncbi:hypothetical protein J3E72DRAFT_270876 [Bipolaris maydis]|nr:hypothetical protein J3E72DRAFT_270876 [Bipolaris maydis]